MKPVRVIFYYDNYCSAASRGGTEVATARISRALESSGKMEVFHAFLRNRSSLHEDAYKGELQLPKGSAFVSTLAGFIRDNGIDVVVNMGRFFRQKKLRKAIEASGRDVRLMFMHHFAPGSERQKPTYKAGLHLLRLNPVNPLYWLRATVYPLLRLPKTLGLGRIYRKVYEMSDRVILLSEGYKKDYNLVSGLADESKFVAIPNIFDAPAVFYYSRKEKRVLILSRMDEIQKRISVALKVWQKTEASGEFADWHLDVVGTGHDMGAVRREARRLGLKNVTFHGWQLATPFLERSSILMMTSDYEGLPLSILEAQAYGVVPIAFDSFASLRDVITDKGDTANASTPEASTSDTSTPNGVIVSPSAGIDGFASSLAALMRSPEHLAALSASAHGSSAAFSPSAVLPHWLRLLSVR